VAHISVKTTAAAIALLVLAILAVGCGGGGDSSSSGSPSGSPTPDPAVRKLSDAKLEWGDLGHIYNWIALAYKNHPEIADLHVFDQPDPITRASQGQNLSACEKGFPGDETRGTVIMETDRMLGCVEVTANYYSVYQQTRYPEVYDIAVAATNYLLSQVPGKKADFDTLLQRKIQDTSPPGLPPATPIASPTIAATPSASNAASPSATR
jgi:hypothetical protein